MGDMSSGSLTPPHRLFLTTLTAPKLRALAQNIPARGFPAAAAERQPPEGFYMPRMTRRKLLADSLLTSAAAILAADAPAWAHTRRGKQSGRRTGPNDTIRIACIGAHGRGVGHASAYAQSGQVILTGLDGMKKK